MTSTPDRPAHRTPWRENKSARPSSPTNPDPSTPPSEVFLVIGRIVTAHGIAGEVKMDVYSDDPERLRKLRRVYFDDDPTARQLSGIRLHGRQALLRFPDVTTRDAAEALRGTIVRVSGSQLRQLDPDELFHYQLIGLAAFLESGEPIGTLTEIIESGEVDVYVVRDEQGHEQLFPALKSVVLDVDPAANRVVVRPQVWEDE
ncbi:MAG: ribosome maturation factor RimM [Thermomicrobiales bacterium]|nr:ribosome maturation factor RimM [Thermomicrobiales bacterium]